MEIQSISRAFAILEYIATHERVGISELSRAMDLNKSTVFGIVKTLVSLGYLFNDEYSKNYMLTYRLQSVAEMGGGNRSFTGYARPILRTLLEHFDETIHLGYSNKMAVLYLDKLESTKAIRIHTHIGTEMPLHCTAIGKAILAYRSHEEILAYAENTGLPPLSPYSITDRDQLLAELSNIRARGYSTDDEEAQENLYCIGVPIHTPKGVLYSLSISMPKYRKNEIDLATAVEELKATANELSKFF